MRGLGSEDGQGGADEGAERVGGVKTRHDGPAEGVLAADSRCVGGYIEDAVGEAERESRRQQRRQALPLAHEDEASGQGKGPSGEQSR